MRICCLFVEFTVDSKHNSAQHSHIFKSQSIAIKSKSCFTTQFTNRVEKLYLRTRRHPSWLQERLFGIFFFTTSRRALRLLTSGSTEIVLRIFANKIFHFTALFKKKTQVANKSGEIFCLVGLLDISFSLYQRTNENQNAFYNQQILTFTKSSKFSNKNITLFTSVHQSHDPSFQPSLHRSFTSRQSNSGLLNLMFTLLCIRHSHCASDCCDVACTGSMANLQRERERETMQ